MSRSFGLGHLVSTHSERCASQWLRVELAGWLRVGVGCDMQTKDEEAASHINMDIIWNVFAPILAGYQNQTPAGWRF